MDSISARFDIMMSEHKDGVVINDAPPKVLAFPIDYQSYGNLYLVPTREVPAFFLAIIDMGYSFAYEGWS